MNWIKHRNGRQKQMTKNASQLIEALEEEPLSDADIRNIVGHECIVAPYSFLRTIYNLDQLFFRYPACILLYRTTKDYGHWVCLVYNKNSKILYYFDSYGKPMDYWLQKQDQRTRESLGQGGDYLSGLVHRAMIYGGLNGFSVSTKALQSSDNHVASCGRYSALRALSPNLSNEEFIRLISDDKGYGTVTDKNVSLLTALLVDRDL